MPQPRILISRTAIEKNLRALIRRSGDLKAFPVLKANAYGLGLREVAQCLAHTFTEAEVPYFCLARMSEVEQAAGLGVKRRILLLSEWPDNLDKLPAGVDLTAASFDDLAILAEHPRSLAFHLKLNTGMNRLGLPIDEFMRSTAVEQKLETLFAKIKKHGHRLEGIYSHLANGDEASSKFSAAQSALFGRAIVRVQEHWGKPVPWVHLANSPGVLNRVGKSIPSVNAFRPGIHLWGVKDPASKVSLAPVLRMQAPLRQLYWIAKGESVGYGRRFVAAKKTRIGILNIGYADGLRRDAWTSGKLAFYFEGQRAPLVGVVSMDMCAVDCTRLKSAPTRGAPFEWIGKKQSLEKIAGSLRTIPYEVLTGLAARVERIVEL